MKKHWFGLVALVLLLPSLMAAFTPSLIAAQVDWQDYEDARALDSDKPIFVFAKMRFCSACAKMEKDVFTDPELAQMLNQHFIPVRETINFAFSRFVFDDLTDKDGETLAFRGFPTVMVVKGEHYSMSQGYKDAERLKQVLQQAIQ